jgi:UDP-N-acetylglucosamine 2-epimerase
LIKIKIPSVYPVSMKNCFLSVVGARPQFIKAALLSNEIRKSNKEILVHTGQHYDVELSDYFFKALEIPKPDYNLEVGSDSHGQQTGKMLIGIEEVILKEKPELVLTYGDTNSTLAGALAAVKLGVRTAHVEAGLRSYNRSMPEEINRVLTDHISDLLFCPTKNAVLNLKKEDLTEGVHLVGDVMYDVALKYRGLASDKKTYERFGLKSNEYILVTMHRPSNTDREENLRNITNALIECGAPVIFPVHPRTMKFLKQYGLYNSLEKKIILIKPVDYLDFINLLLNCKKIVTDSGGVQKEAYFFEKPCITLRSETEWVETVKDGWNVLVGADAKRIINAIQEFKPKGKRGDHYGQGQTVRQIIKILDEYAN